MQGNSCDYKSLVKIIEDKVEQRIQNVGHSVENVQISLQNVESKVDNFNNGMEQSVEICGMKKQIEVITNYVELIEHSLKAQ